MDVLYHVICDADSTGFRRSLAQSRGGLHVPFEPLGRPRPLGWLRRIQSAFAFVRLRSTNEHGRGRRSPMQTFSRSWSMTPTRTRLSPRLRCPLLVLMARSPSGTQAMPRTCKGLLETRPAERHISSAAAFARLRRAKCNRLRSYQRRRSCSLPGPLCVWDVHASRLCRSLLPLAFDLEKSPDMVGARRTARASRARRTSSRHWSRMHWYRSAVAERNRQTYSAWHIRIGNRASEAGCSHVTLARSGLRRPMRDGW